MAGDVLHLNVFQMVPDAFVGIQVWGIARQLLQAQLITYFRYERVNGPVMMNRRSIPNDRQSAAQLAHQVPEEAHDISAFERAGLYRHQQLAWRSYRADDR